MSIDEQLEIVQAVKDGKKAQVYAFSSWYQVSEGHLFDFQHNKYRVAPEPREIWLPENAKGYVTKQECQSLWPNYIPVLYREVL